ncbi:MAG TPA: hypothetical protein VIH16_00545 [Bellilinea sp.]
MNHKTRLFKQIFTVCSILIIAALFLTACGEGFTLEGAVKPNEEGGLDITGGVQPEATAQPGAAAGLDTTTILLIVIGVLALIVIIALVSRGSSRPAE